MKFLIGFLVTIGLLIVVFVLIFRGAANNDEAVQQAPKLVDFANTSTIMQFTEKGPVKSDQTHQEIRITVSNVETAIEVFNGYQGKLIQSKTYRNNTAAYADFLSALELAGYTKGNKTPESADERGFCPTGVRFVMGIKDGSEEIQRFWASTCESDSETFQGNSETVRRLFQAQVPDYREITSTLRDL